MLRINFRTILIQLVFINFQITLAKSPKFSGINSRNRSSRLDRNRCRVNSQNVVSTRLFPSQSARRALSFKALPRRGGFRASREEEVVVFKLGLSTRENVKATTRPLRRIKRIGVGPRQCRCHRRYWLCGDCGGCCCCCCCWLEDGEPLDCC